MEETKSTKILKEVNVMKYAAIKISRHPRLLKKFRTRSAALKWRTKYYAKGGKAKHVGILSARGFIGPRSY
jgi:hypothetical protein